LVFVQLEVGSYKNFCYVIGDDKTKECAVVDPGFDLERIKQEIVKRGLKTRYIINTHAHFDHINGNPDLAKETGADIIMHENSHAKKDLAVKDGQILKLGSIELRFIHTPGHSPESMCILVDGKLLTGDTLFVGECGRVDLPGGSAEELYHTFFDKLMKLDDNLEIFPGHDYGMTKSSTLALEKKNNYTLRPRSKEEFVKFMSEP
jgi:hydroxyacylglutathione hydrolase